MFPPEVIKTIGETDGSGSRARAPFSSAPGNDRGAICALVVASLLVCSAPAHAQKPLEIGVLALGPRNMPAWRCGPGTPQPAAAEARRETRPFYITGLMDELEKLKYVENRPENAGKPGRRFVLDLRMGTLPEVKGFAQEYDSTIY